MLSSASRDGVSSHLCDHLHRVRSEQSNPSAKTVRRRKIGRISLEDADRLLRTAWALRGTDKLVPRGVYRFRSFEEADEWLTKTMARTYCAYARRPPANLPLPQRSRRPVRPDRGIRRDRSWGRSDDPGHRLPGRCFAPQCLSHEGRPGGPRGQCGSRSPRHRRRRLHRRAGGRRGHGRSARPCLWRFLCGCDDGFRGCRSGRNSRPGCQQANPYPHQTDRSSHG